jgi:muramoyltetrapeptide carboxypeptidase
MAFFKKAGLATFAGPMVIPNFSRNISSFTEKNFWRTISSPNKRISVEAKILFGMNTKNLSGVSGRILGGNIAVLTSLIGSKYFPDLKESILFLEEVGEPPYKIDRMLNQLKLNNVFKKVKGIVLGSFIDCTEKDITKRTLTLEQIFEDYYSKLNIPVFHSFPHGHINDLITFPFGVKVKLNLRSEKIEFLESGVR